MMENMGCVLLPHYFGEYPKIVIQKNYSNMKDVIVIF